MKTIIKTLVLFSASIASLQAMGQRFTTSYTSATSTQDFSGKVFLYLSKDAKSPKDDMVGVHSFPCFSIDVKNVKPGQKVVFDDKAVSYPTALSDIERGTYYAQVVWDKNEGGRSIAKSAGNLFNNAIVVKITKDIAKTFDITCTEVIKGQSFTETQFVKELKMPSALLTAFYKRPSTVDAAVLLPKEYYNQPNRKFPVLYWVAGYGGDYHGYSGENAPSDPLDVLLLTDAELPMGYTGREDFLPGNIEAHQRMIAQYALAGATRGLVIGTDHAAEALVGFFTKFGDGGADILPLFTLNKRQNRALLKELGAPEKLWGKAPTADLLDGVPGRTDEDELGISYDDIDDYLEGRDIAPEAAANIERRYLQSRHKRTTPVSVLDTWWK